MDTGLADHREQAQHLHDTLAEQLQTLRFLEYELRHTATQNTRERVRARTVVTAIEHLQQAINALEEAGRD